MVDLLRNSFHWVIIHNSSSLLLTWLTGCCSQWDHNVLMTWLRFYGPTCVKSGGSHFFYQAIWLLWKNMLVLEYFGIHHLQGFYFYYREILYISIMQDSMWKEKLNMVIFPLVNPTISVDPLGDGYTSMWETSWTTTCKPSIKKVVLYPS